MISHHDDVGLTVVHAGTPLLSGLHLPRYLPANGWRFGLGARSIAQVAEFLDECVIDSLRLRGGTAYLDEIAPLRLTLNGQDFVEHRPLDAHGSIKGYTCLLYTSPSPRDGLLSRMPSSA